MQLFLKLNTIQQQPTTIKPYPTRWGRPKVKYHVNHKMDLECDSSWLTNLGYFKGKKKGFG